MPLEMYKISSCNFRFKEKYKTYAIDCIGKNLRMTIANNEH